MRCDPSGLGGGINRYGYAAQHPTCLADKTGLVPTVPTPGEPYTIQRGDNLWNISIAAYDGDPGQVGVIASANGIENENLIYAGNTILIPEGPPAAEPEATTTGRRYVPPGGASPVRLADPDGPIRRFAENMAAEIEAETGSKWFGDALLAQTIYKVSGKSRNRTLGNRVLWVNLNPSDGRRTYVHEAFHSHLREGSPDERIQKALRLTESAYRGGTLRDLPTGEKGTKIPDSKLWLAAEEAVAAYVDKRFAQVQQAINAVQDDIENGTYSTEEEFRARIESQNRVYQNAIGKIPYPMYYFDGAGGLVGATEPIPDDAARLVDEALDLPGPIYDIPAVQQMLGAEWNR